MQPISVLEALETRQLLSLTVDLRLADTGAKEITVDHIGQVVKLEAWAIVTGANDSISDEGIQTLVGSFLSSNVIGSGSVRGTLKAVQATPFNANGSQTAQQVDLDGDGDLDAGSNNDIQAAGFFAGRSASPTEDGAPAPVGGAQFKVANVTFTVTSLLSGGETDLNFRPRNIAVGAVALWKEDGSSSLLNQSNGALLVGTPVVVLSTGGTSPVGSIAGTVFNDADQSEVRDAGDSALLGWTVFLDTDQDGKLGAGELSTTTDADGAYSFTNLTPGDYHVAQVVQPGYTQLSPATANWSFTLVMGEDRMGVDFADSAMSQVRGTIYNDTNANGQRDAGETPLAAADAFIDLNHNSYADDGEPRATTNSQGLYIFKLMPAGQYDVRYRVGTSGHSGLPIARQVVVPVMPAVVTGVDFGDIAFSTNISGSVLKDLNGNGVIDAEDEFGNGISGVQVWLETDNDGVFETGELGTVTTGQAGNYAFFAVPPGTYTLRVQIPAGYAPTTPAGGIYTVTADASTPVTTGKDFLFQPLPPPPPPPTVHKISGTVYDDANANGQRDANEKALPLWGVYLDANKNALFDFGEKITLTNSSGNYSFSNLKAGTYRVRELLYRDYRRVTPDAGYYDVTLSSSDVGGKLFGNTRLGFVKGTVFKDSNGNGKRQPNEVGLAGFRVWDDTDNDGKLDANEKSTLTDANGNYTLNIGAGWHTIRVQPKAGFRWTGVAYYKVLTGYSTRVYDRNFGQKPVS